MVYLIISVSISVPFTLFFPSSIEYFYCFFNVNIYTFTSLLTSECISWIAVIALVCCLSCIISLHSLSIISLYLLFHFPTSVALFYHITSIVALLLIYSLLHRLYLFSILISSSFPCSLSFLFNFFFLPNCCIS